MNSLFARLLALVAAAVLLAGAGTWLLLGRFTRLDAERFAVAEAREQAARFVPALEAHRRAHGGWARVEATLERIAAGTGRTPALLLEDGSVLLPPSLGASGARARALRGGGREVTWQRLAGGRRELAAFRLHGGSVLGDGSVFHLLPSPGAPAGLRRAEPPAAQRFVHGVRRSGALAAALAVLAALALAFALARGVVRPLEALTRAVRRLDAGDLDARADVRSRDEVGALARAFNQMAERVAATERQRRALVSDVAHELRTPLTNLQARLEAMQDGLVAADRPALDSLHEEILHLARLVDDLEQLAAGDAGRLAVELAPVPLDGPIAQAIAALAPRAARAGVTVAAGGDAGRIVRADARRLGQVLRNLLDNAIAHTPAGGTIAVRVATVPGDASAVEIAVADSGEGIPAAHLERVFERFHRVDPSRARTTGGSGLGLAVVRQLVVLMGGTVRATSVPGRGATVAFTLPAFIGSSRAPAIVPADARIPGRTDRGGASR